MSRRGLRLIVVAVAFIAAAFVLPAVASAAMTNSECLQCHSSIRPQNFDVGTVDRDTACRKCHVDGFVGSHPYHNTNGNCGAQCHPGWGAALGSNVPSVVTTAGAFATSTSQDTPAALLHIIHSKARWESSVIKNGTDCGSCHAVAACTACHENTPAPHSTHANHASLSTTVTPWVGTISYGQAIGKVTGATVRCGAVGCHDTSKVASSTAGLFEDFNLAAAPEYGYLEPSVVTQVGSWTAKTGIAYTAGLQRISNYATSSLAMTFTGEQVSLVTDKDPYRGIARIYIDGVAIDTVDLYRPTTKYQVVSWTSPILASGTHTIMVKPTGTKSANARAAFVSVDQFRVYSKTPGSISPTCVSCHTGQATNHGTYTWPHEATQTAGTYYNGGTGNYRCDSCHSMVFVNEHNRTTSSSVGKSCSNCHSTYAPMKITGSWVANDGCNYQQCHATATSRQPHASITASHTVPTDASLQPCRDCHAGDLAVIHNNSITTNAYTTNCNTCHTQSKFPATNSCADTAGCHTVSGISVVDDHPQNATFTARHTPSSMTSTTQSPGPDGAIYTATKNCSACHSAKLTTAHATTSIGAISCTSGGTGNTGCHFNTSLNSMSVAKTGWTTDKCAECHDYGTAKTHDTATTTHVVPAGSCAGTGTSCHNYTDLAAMHAVNQAGGTAKYASCTNNDAGDPTGCHSTLDKRPARWASDTTSCGQGTSGCHTDKSATNHGGKHALNLIASNYSPATATGCTNSGAGCHGSSTSTNIATYHPNSGCTTGPCHTSASKPTHHETFVCVDCHDGTYTGAADTTALPDLAPAGHFNETSHTVSADTSVSSGGTASARCSSCHSPSVGTQRDLYAQHQGFSASQVASSAVATSMACAQCHNYSPAITAVITTKWPTKTCAECHDGGLGKVQAQHGATAPVVTGTSPQSCGGSGTNCHTTYDLHALHKNAAGGCGLTGCHDYTKQGLKPTSKSCGSGGGTCHTTYTEGVHYDAHKSTHTSTLQGAATYTLNGTSTTCASCHGMELNAEHILGTSAMTGTGSVCLKCHNRADSTTAISGKWSGELCSACHGVGTIAAPHSNVAAHTVTTNTGCGASGAGCHPTNDLSKVGTDKTANIHNDCVTCHDPAGATSWVYGVAGNMKYNPLIKSCGQDTTGCHQTAFYSSTTGVHDIGQAGVVDGVDAKHTATGMTATVGTYTYKNTCANCHSATLGLAHKDTSSTAVLDSGNTGWGSTAQTTCLDCHNAAATAKTVASAGVIKGSWSAKTCAQCHTTTHSAFANHSVTAGSGCTLTTGCHGYTGSALDVRAIHDKVNSGCTAKGGDSKGWSGGCHEMDKAMTTTAMSCGSGATGQACHTNHTATNHMPAHDANDAESVNCTKSGCHEYGATRSLATTSVIDLHSVVTIGATVSGKTNDGCNICHGGSGWTDVHATAKANATGFKCTGCHNGTVVGAHTYTGRDSASAHYSSNITTHTTTAGNATDAAVTNTGGYACTQCHSLEMWPAHVGPTSVAFSSVPGTYADKCVACHEVKVDNLTGAWNHTCVSCHTVATVHTALATSHNATNAVIPTPGPSWTDAVPSGGWSDGFESGDFSNWTSADQPAATAVWNATMSGTTNWTSTIAPTTPALGRAFATNTNTTAGALRTAQTTGQTSSDTIYVRYRGTSGVLTDGTMTSAGYNLSTYNSARLSWYDTLVGYVAGDYVNVQWSDDGGATWTTEAALTANEGSTAQGGWVYHEVTLPSAKLGTSCMVRFVYHQVASGQYTFCLDNIKIEGLQIPGWSVQGTTVNTGADAAQATGGDATTRYLTETGITQSGSSTTLSYAISWSSLEAVDDVQAQYTTNGGTSWVTAKNYAPSGTDPANLAWTAETLTGLPNTVNGVRFLFLGNETNDLLYIDDVSLMPVGPSSGASTAGASCSNNPNGTECHNVSDVAALHNNTVSKCTACHKNNTTAPTLECQTAGCHAGVNLSEHVQKGSGTVAHHENAGSFTTYATGNECAGCHDDSVANEHFVLTAYTSKPCSVCHATSYTVGTYSPAKATVTAQITAKNITCNGCHTTSTATSPHAQRMGSTTTLGSTQFGTNWSGHRVWSTMPGSKTSWTTAVDGATQSLSLNAVGNWLSSGWTATSMVTCADCHGTIAGATGPHGAAATINLAPGYDNSYSLGTLTLSGGTTMSNTTNLCAKCHPSNLGTGNSAHDQGGNHSTACISCHVNTPHAWKRPRLIGYTTDPAPYKSNIVTGIQTTVTSPNNWSKGNCAAPTGSCNTHSTITSNLWP